MKLTADIFVVRDGRILLLERKGSSEGLWYIPGGFVEPGEDPQDAALREAYEETELAVADVQILRAWCYRLPDDRFAYHITYFGRSDDGAVTISREHSGYRWCDPAEYRDTYLPSAVDKDDPTQASWYPQLCKNVDLLAHRLGAPGAG